MRVEDIEARAAALRDQVLKTWAPPLFGPATPAQVAQTSSMQTIAFLMGKEFLPGLNLNQQMAIDQAMELFEQVFSHDQLTSEGQGA